MGHLKMPCHINKCCKQFDYGAIRTNIFGNLNLLKIYSNSKATGLSLPNKLHPLFFLFVPISFTRPDEEHPYKIVWGFFLSPS